MDKNKNAELIDRVKSISQLTYAAIGYHLGVHHSTVFQWRRGGADTSPEIVSRLEKIEKFFQENPPLKPRKRGKRPKK